MDRMTARLGMPVFWLCSCNNNGNVVSFGVRQVTEWEAAMYVKYVPVLSVIGLSVCVCMFVFALIGRRKPRVYDVSHIKRLPFSINPRKD